MSDTAWTVTAARKAFRCEDGCCKSVVDEGDRYVRLCAFPGSDFFDGPGVWVLRVCEPCYTRYGKPMPPTRAEQRAVS